jgi:hypothetical protein
LLVDVDDQLLVALCLGVFDELAPAAVASLRGLEEQRGDLVAGERHEPDWHVPRLDEHPKLEPVVAQRLPDT